MVNINSIEFVTLMLWSVIYSTAADEWPPLNIYSFSPINPSETKELNGCITKKCNLDDGSPVNEQDQFFGIAVYADRYDDGNCYGGGFCSSGYMVTKGEIMNDSETDVVTAYQVDLPSAPASSFTASKTKLMFKIDAPSDDEYSVFEFIPGEAGGLATFSVKDTFVPVDGEYVETQVAIYNLGKPSIFFAIPSSSDMSIWPAAEAGTTTQKATVFDMTIGNPRVSLFAQLLDVSPKTPFQPASGWNEGPNKHNHKYGFRKMFTRLVKQDGAGDRVLWQDQKDSESSTPSDPSPSASPVTSGPSYTSSPAEPDSSAPSDPSPSASPVTSAFNYTSSPAEPDSSAPSDPSPSASPVTSGPSYTSSPAEPESFAPSDPSPSASPVTSDPITSGSESPTFTSQTPTAAPESVEPSVPPTEEPTVSSATGEPTASPLTAATTDSPLAAPTISPTTAPTISPTTAPTISPTTAPTISPTTAPTAASTQDVISALVDSLVEIFENLVNILELTA